MAAQERFQFKERFEWADNSERTDNGHPREGQQRAPDGLKAFCSAATRAAAIPLAQRQKKERNTDNGCGGTFISQDPMRSARGVARAALQIDLQLLELGDVLIDALLPFLAQWFPDLRWYRMDIRQNG